MNTENGRLHLSPVMVMVKPSYSFPGSFRLGTFELTVKPSLVLLLNCFRKKHTKQKNKKKTPIQKNKTKQDVVLL